MPLTLTKVTEAVLRQFDADVPVTIRDLNLMPELADTLSASGSKGAVYMLAQHELVRRCGHRARDQGAGTLFDITPRGERALQAIDDAVRTATTAGPRQAIGTGCYRGEELKPYAGRAGAMDAFDLPSVHNGEVVDRARPMLLGTPPDKRA